MTQVDFQRYATFSSQKESLEMLESRISKVVFFGEFVGPESGRYKDSSHKNHQIFLVSVTRHEIVNRDTVDILTWHTGASNSAEPQ